MDALTDLLHAVETVLESWTYPERIDPGAPVCYVHPDALVALEEAYDQMMDGRDDDDRDDDELLVVIEDGDEML